MSLLLAAALALSLDTDGMIRINGERVFIVGAYDLPKIAEPLKTAKTAGFNLVHANRQTIGAARAAGLYAWATTGSKPDGIRPIVNALKDDSSLIIWEIEDEPTFVWKKPREIRTTPETMIAARKLVQSIDPQRLFYLNQSPTNLVPTLRRYNDSTDIVATDIYPVIPRGIRNQYALWPDGQQGDLLNETISQVGQYADKMRQVAGPSKPVFMVLQGFAWESIQKQIDPKMLLYPTAAKARFMAYQSIVHGANGILYWGLHLGPPDNPAWQAAKSVAAELKTIAPELAARPLATKLTIDYIDTGHSLDRGIEYIVKPSGRGSLIIAVNADKNPVEAVIKGPGACVHKDTIEPFGVRLYRCDAQ
ncbi:MAG: hypothetical protein FJW32_05830 [Acidobacteria bacterium]|nr:hypothetical protein [Acidobacteriota bacterium]